MRRGESLDDIYNYLPIEGLYSTSGQPTEKQFAAIQEAGFTTVINLAPTSVFENSVVNEREILAALGMRYVHIPVDFMNPGEDDFEQFVDALDGQDCSKVWVHCAANMRVSAFTYRYRRALMNETESLARPDLNKIWNPLGVWKAFISR